MPGDRRFDHLAGLGILEARYMDRERVEPRGVERLDDGLDQRQIAALHQRPVEDEGGDGAAVCLGCSVNGGLG